jgi:hypothetical protein
MLIDIICMYLDGLISVPQLTLAFDLRLDEDLAGRQPLAQDAVEVAHVINNVSGHRQRRDL